LLVDAGFGEGWLITGVFNTPVVSTAFAASFRQPR
jgi:hypothetical protein